MIFISNIQILMSVHLAFMDATKYVEIFLDPTHAVAIPAMISVQMGLLV
jgi:hypothetical protein